MLFAYEAHFSVNMLWLPVLLLIQLIGTIGVSLILAVLGTYLSDLANIIQFVLRLCFYLSPVLYSVETRIPKSWEPWYKLLNPFAGLLESYKNILVRGSPPSEYVGVAAAMAVVVFVFGFWYFARDEHKLVKAI
jgi:lipopolysaccharide transport system permease protein